MFGGNGEQAQRPKYFGKYPAVVVDNASSGGGAHLAKVKVRVPAILEEDESGDPRPIEVVARPCLPPGFFFVPEVGAHVWVEFGAGELDTPIWVGVWYPDDATPAAAGDTAPSEKQQVIRTPGEHVITLDDDAGTIVIEDKHGNTVTLGSNGIELAGGGAVQKLLTESGARALLDLINAHQHTGYQSTPTSPPTIPLEAGDWFTAKTKAQ